MWTIILSVRPTSDSLSYGRWFYFRLRRNSIVAWQPLIDILLLPVSPRQDVDTVAALGSLRIFVGEGVMEVCVWAGGGNEPRRLLTSCRCITVAALVFGGEQ